MKKSSTNVYHLISNTHWDREWRFPFQRNRQMLVDMIDAVMDILEKEPEYRAFHLDSQSIVLKDYLEIKPQNRERIIHLTQEGRLLHGPWYILPEEFQVGGENLIRNLLLGHKTSAMYGGVSKIGYSPFSWGQISQLPQIYNQFGIELIMFYRGINSMDSPKSEFLWIGADGTEMVSSRFSTMPRYNFYFYIYRPVAHNEGFGDVEYPWNKNSTAFHFADPQQYLEDYFIISSQKEYHPENILPQVEKITTDQDDDFTTPHKIWMEGHDSSGPNAITVKILQDISEKTGLDVRHSTLVDYAQALAKSVNRDALVKVTGERRSSQNNRRCGNLFGYTSSARMYLKQANFDAERWIQIYAEPFNIFSGMRGRDIRDLYPETAWELIVQNSAHDSIGGCSLDRIHEDMIFRYKHAVEISKGIFERSLKYLLNEINTGNFPTARTIPENEQIFITAINPIQFNRNDVSEAWIDIPVNLDKGGIEIFDFQGEKLSFDLLNRTPCQPVLEQMINRPMYFNMIRYHLRVHFPSIPAFGMKVFHVLPITNRQQNSQILQEDYLENSFLRVKVNADGSLDVTDKIQGRTYSGIAWFLDEGEGGHAWLHEKVGERMSTKNSKAEILNSAKGLVFQEITIRHVLKIPVDLSSRKKGGELSGSVEIILKVGLEKDSPRLELNLDIHNAAESHRLRMMFPSGMQAGYSWGEGQFDVVQRKLDRPDTSDWIEQPMYDYPMHHFVDLSDGLQGVAILSDGLKEYEVCDDPDQTLAITLFRTFEYRINPSAPQDYSYEKGSQMLGHSTYRLAFYPHKGNWDQGNVYSQAFRFCYPLRLVQTGSLSGKEREENSFLSLQSGKLIVSALKKPENESWNGCILRVFNPTEDIVEEKIRLNTSLKHVYELNLEEKILREITVSPSGDFQFTAMPKKIYTFFLEYKM